MIAEPINSFTIVAFYVVAAGAPALLAINVPLKSPRPLHRVLIALALFLASLAVLEVCSLIALRVNTGMWLYREPVNPNSWLFDSHPNLVALPSPNKRHVMGQSTATHNSLGFRGDEFPAKSEKIRVVTVGGSTTYCVGVSDQDTWPAQLGKLLGTGYEVLNLGVPGHATTEHLVMLGTVVPRFSPDVVVFHVGLNDMHCMHDVKNSELVNRCHGDLLYNSLGQCFVNRMPRLAILRAGVTILQNVGLAGRCPAPSPLINTAQTVDPLVMAAFRENVRQLAAMTRELGAIPVFVPQVGFNESLVAKGEYRWWTPNLDQSKLEALLNDFAGALREIAQTRGAPYVEDVEAFSWNDDLFVDSSHLNAEGNRKLAKLVASKITTIPPQQK